MYPMSGKMSKCGVYAVKNQSIKDRWNPMTKALQQSPILIPRMGDSVPVQLSTELVRQRL